MKSLNIQRYLLLSLYAKWFPYPKSHVPNGGPVWICVIKSADMLGCAAQTFACQAWSIYLILGNFFCCKSISTGAQYVTLDNKVKCLSLAVSFGNPTNKTVTGTTDTWEPLIENHLDQSLWSTNQKYWSTVRSNLLRSFLEVHNCVAPFTSRGKLHEFGAEKPISWGKPAHFDFFTINFTVWRHILSTSGDDLTTL